MTTPSSLRDRRNFFRGGRLRALTLLLLLAGARGRSVAQSGSADEYEIRAAMLFNLTRYIDWPAAKVDAAHPEFVICILGADPLGLTIDTFARNKTVGTKPVVIRHLNSAETALGCHILYVGVGGDKLKNFKRSADDLAKAGVLSVSERANADSPDQVVGLPTVEQHLRIDVNLGAAQRSGLTISSKLLHLATVTR